MFAMVDYQDLFTCSSNSGQNKNVFDARLFSAVTHDKRPICKNQHTHLMLQSVALKRGR